MNYFTPAEFVENYEALGEKKANTPALKLFLLGILAGLLIGFAGVTTNTASHAFDNVSVIRTISGLLFPFGLVMVILVGTELFTGNCLITISVLSNRTTALKMLRNLGIVYFGNFIGAILLAVACAYFGQFNYSHGELAVYTIKVATAKCSLPFANAFVMGVLCNILVCVAVMCAMCAKDIAGKVLGAYVPICFFITCGFEHSIANMYYIPAGLFALSVPKYAELAAAAGMDVSNLTWSNFFVANLVPVTLGNIVGGVGFAVIMWYCYKKQSSKKTK